MPALKVIVCDTAAVLSKAAVDLDQDSSYLHWAIIL